MTLVHSHLAVAVGDKVLLVFRLAADAPHRSEMRPDFAAASRRERNESSAAGLAFAGPSLALFVSRFPYGVQPLRSIALELACLRHDVPSVLLQ